MNRKSTSITRISILIQIFCQEITSSIIYKYKFSEDEFTCNNLMKEALSVACQPWSDRKASTISLIHATHQQLLDQKTNTMTQMH